MNGLAEHMDSATAASALRWWADAGVDVLVDNHPASWLERAKPRVAPLPDEKPVADPMPDTLDSFVAWLKSADMPEAGPTTQRIPASGNAASGLMILVDMPEAEDEQRDSLLSGDCGLLFEKMLAAMGRDRQSCYMAALSPSRPASGLIADDSLPVLADIARHHIGLARPKRLWLMGNATSRAILGMDLIKARGSLYKINHGGSIVEAVVSFAPPFLLKNPQRKAAAWADMQALMEGLSS